MNINRRILIIEDDEILRQTYKEILSSNNLNEINETGSRLFGNKEANEKFVDNAFYPSLAKNGIKGIEMVKEAKASNKPFATAFIDMKMPGLNGAKTAAEIWKVDPKIKIVIVTAYSEFSPEEILSTAGRRDLFFLKKPFDQMEVIQFASALTKMRELENINFNINKNLEKKVDEKTKELLEANRLLEKLNSEKTQFLYYLSHEINTPLNWIGTASIIDKSEINTENRKFLDFIEKGFYRISMFMNTMLSYFDIAEMKEDFDKIEIKINEIVQEILNEKKSKIEHKSLKVEASYLGDISLLADKLLFKQLINTLIDNAIDFSLPGGRVEIKTGKRADESILFRIKDYGRGVKKEDIDKIFIPFANEEANRHGKIGFGLNLPCAKQITRLHSLSLNVVSDGEGEGSLFILKKRDLNG